MSRKRNNEICAYNSTVYTPQTAGEITRHCGYHRCLRYTCNFERSACCGHKIAEFSFTTSANTASMRTHDRAKYTQMLEAQLLSLL